MFAITEDKIEI